MNKNLTLLVVILVSIIVKIKPSCITKKLKANLVKDFPDVGLAFSEPHGEHLRSFDADEVGLALVGDGLGEQGLTATRGSVEKHTLARGHSEFEELFRVLNWVLKIDC